MAVWSYRLDMWVDDVRPPLRVPKVGDLVVEVTEATCAPPGWVAAVAAAPGAKYPPLFCPEGALAASEPMPARPNPARRVPDATATSTAQPASWRTRLLRLRYRYLAAFPLWDHGPYDDRLTPELHELRRKMITARAAAEKAESRYRAARDAWVREEVARLGFRPVPNPAPPKPRLGRRGDLEAREATRALLRLYRELFGREPKLDFGPQAAWQSA
jgi:hypothetical protein